MCFPKALSIVVDIEALGRFPSASDVICYGRWILIEGSKNYCKDVCLLNSEPTFLISPHFWEWNGHISNLHKLDNVESQLSKL